MIHKQRVFLVVFLLSVVIVLYTGIKIKQVNSNENNGDMINKPSDSQIVKEDEDLQSHIWLEGQVKDVKVINGGYELSLVPIEEFLKLDSNYDPFDTLTIRVDFDCNVTVSTSGDQLSISNIKSGDWLKAEIEVDKISNDRNISGEGVNLALLIG